MSLFLNNIREHLDVVQKLHLLSSVVQEVGLLSANILRNGGKIFFCGNGGSAADSQHLAAELTGRLYRDRRPLAAVALSADTSVLTCISNDFSFDQVFSRQITSLGRKNDLLIAISTSGKSVNVVQAAQEANRIGLQTVGLTGGNGGDLSGICRYNIIVPSVDTARIQESHILIGHTICGLIEQELF
ncbi:D-sedoheptulose 7-phosphate isomerase [Cyanobium sp. HWJ4-Hawea]|uniref:D-sedoheptulose-7-phosphate isomerase n=1 Tax=Cyanobium sp. HWJ4-Hawea TaxID=2823713 RepID=UPI0020CBAA77|nr:D-sedoheptulose 7-phosphate isomerase [Cyanobium sp. HWJ4-Hawea]MCP9808496.1 D-sedoheptulose 7-phosphate isomerase [Cyanobium sp. HWJ4-Hawea]